MCNAAFLTVLLALSLIVRCAERLHRDLTRHTTNATTAHGATAVALCDALRPLLLPPPQPPPAAGALRLPPRRWSCGVIVIIMRRV